MIKDSFFVSVEGSDGTGKSTIINKVAKSLSTSKKFKGYKIFKTFEPGKTRTGNRIRKILLDNETVPSPMSEIFLYLADRADHYEKFIKPIMKDKGNIIISDRFFESTFVYQCLTRKVVTFEQFIELHKIILKNFKPDFSIVLNSKFSHGLKGDRLDLETEDFKKNIKQNYKDLKKYKKFFNYPIHFIDTTKQDWNKYLKIILQIFTNNCLQK
ncbi:MAG: dTMP kinase [Halanaerobiales bacterium]